MAVSFAAAIAEIEGPEFDLVVGYAIPPREHAPTDDEIKAAFERFDYRQVRRIARQLSSRCRRHQADAEDAVHETLVDLLVKRPDLYRQDPKEWLGLLYAVSRFRLADIRVSSRRTESIEGLREMAGDAPFSGARPCLPPSLDADEESKYAPPPAQGEAWNSTQIIGALQRFRDYYGRPPKAKECNSFQMLPSSPTVRRRFGDFANAVLAAGMVPDTFGQRRKRWSAIEAARACLAFRRRHGRWPDWADLKRNLGDLPGREVMIRFFGGTRPAEVQQGTEAILAGA
jgi:DNA-directed RNA polymerase specialized sigma24 family protein